LSAMVMMMMMISAGMGKKVAMFCWRFVNECVCSG
jgi:hypothetical protein